MKLRAWYRRNRRNIRLLLLVIIIGLGIFAWSLREPPINANYRLVPLFEEMYMPTSLDQIEGDNKLIISQRLGMISVYQDGNLLETPFLNLEDKVEATHIEQGLFRVLFDPNVSENGFLYVHYTAQPDGQTVVERYTISEDNPNTADPDSAELVYSMIQENEDHNGGDMQFGSDGYLYISLGDSGVSALAADTSYAAGSIIRLDVRNFPDIIPETNPFIDNDDAAPEIWAYGLRNPWRFSFDRETGDMYIGDVGASEYEEINFVSYPLQAGLNFGWDTYEAYELRGEQELDNVEFPVYAYEHQQEGIDARLFQCSVTGGFVYRGEALPDLQGHYLFGDWCSGSIWTLERNSEGEWIQEPFMETAFRINSFGEDADGELYVLTVADGIWKLVAR